MDRQRIFNLVAAHLFVQGQDSRKTPSGFCAYRSGSLRCAIGALLTPSEIAAAGDFEGTVSELFWDFPEIKTRLQVSTVDDEIFLQKLQRIHDQAPPQEWPDSLRRLAALNGLIPPKIIAKRISQ